MPGGADGKRVSRRRAFPKASKRDGPGRAPACRTPQDKTRRLCTRAVRAAGISCGSPRRCGLRFACGRRFACALLPCLRAATSPVRCCLACVPPLCLCAAALPACVLLPYSYASAFHSCHRLACVPPAHIAPWEQRASPAAFPENPYAASRKFDRDQVRKGETWAAQKFFEFFEKRLAFSKIIGYNNQALERDAKKQNMDD